MFGLGGVPLTNAETSATTCASYLPILCVAAVASAPLGDQAVSQSLPQRAAQVSGVVLILAGLVVCTAYLVDGTYNPFLYFRF